MFLGSVFQLRLVLLTVLDYGSCRPPQAPLDLASSEPPVARKFALRQLQLVEAGRTPKQARAAVDREFREAGLLDPPVTFILKCILFLACCMSPLQRCRSIVLVVLGTILHAKSWPVPFQAVVNNEFREAGLLDSPVKFIWCATHRTVHMLGAWSLAVAILRSCTVSRRRPGTACATARLDAAMQFATLRC